MQLQLKTEKVSERFRIFCVLSDSERNKTFNIITTKAALFPTEGNLLLPIVAASLQKDLQLHSQLRHHVFTVRNGCLPDIAPHAVVFQRDLGIMTFHKIVDAQV